MIKNGFGEVHVAEVLQVELSELLRANGTMIPVETEYDPDLGSNQRESNITEVDDEFIRYGETLGRYAQPTASSAHFTLKTDDGRTFQVMVTEVEEGGLG